MNNSFYSSPPPNAVRIWLDKSPMIFLIISAFLFIAGLNFFAYQSRQVCQNMFGFNLNFTVAYYLGIRHSLSL